ncbi:putative polysaccharide biosynthesis protein [Listeria booriae]|uniref:putative polysaccharide biosynthesis protein n=1 Tax=Listeria booriae TaxID=1552123 RepID=UPI00162ADE7E|nr:polysaccharide biosynthesis protein [Listeria booriae]MBC1234068.1 polysaccharide biosynthesis protein [Listeria booriae]MBC1246316.1 polysaccharide biosynthesis protein [Listeria booriae]MBC2365263.1 polysaccharide biosynthesis protein [Listeria booriae]
MAQKTIKNLMQGAVWLTLASLLSKILSAVYRIPFQNMVGDIGFYIFQQVYPIYGIAMTLALVGFPVIVSRMIAEEKDVTKREVIFQFSLQVMFGVGIVFFLLIFFGADFIARVMGDYHLTILIRVISFAFLLMPFLASLRGFFQGHEQMMPTAVSQTIEQLVRVVIIIAGATGAVALGWNLYMTGAVAMSGAVIGGLGAFGTLLYFYWRKKPEKIVFTKKWASWAFTKQFLAQSIAVCTTSAMLILFQLLDSFQVYRLMRSSGIDATAAKELKGIYDRGQPLLQLGLVLCMGLALAIVPMITAAKARGETRELRRSVLLIIKLTILLSGAATLGLIAIMRPTNQMLFETAAGTGVLQVFILSLFLSSLIVSMSSILQGFGNMAGPAVAVCIGLIVKLATNAILVPRFATYGASWSTVIGLGATLIICYILLKRQLPIPFIRKNMIGWALLAFLAMIIVPVAWETFWPLTSRIGSAVQALFGALIGGIIFFYCLIKFNLLTKRDLVFMPFGSKLLWLTTKIRRR